MTPGINHPTDRPNFSVVNFGELTLWFSYQTVIAFDSPVTGQVISENAWGPTTGRHLNYINSDRSERKPREEFKRLLELATEPHIIQEVSLAA